MSVVALSGWLCLHVHCSHYSVYFITLNSNCVALLADNIHTISYWGVTLWCILDSLTWHKVWRKMQLANLKWLQSVQQATSFYVFLLL